MPFRPVTTPFRPSLREDPAGAASVSCQENNRSDKGGGSWSQAVVSDSTLHGTHALFLFAPDPHNLIHTTLKRLRKAPMSSEAL